MPGAEWSGEIDAHLRSAELILLLISVNFIASDYICGVELVEAMKRQDRNEASVVPIVICPVNLEPEDVDAMPFLKLQGLPTDLRPVTSWPNRDEAWVDVAKGLRATVKNIQASRPPAPAPRGMPPADTFHAFEVEAVGNAPAPPDATLQRVVDGVVDSVQRALAARGAAPLASGGLGDLQREAISLIDLPDAKRVLWVDDHPRNNFNEVAALSKLQIEVVAVRSTAQAMRRIEEDREGFDLVISDWARPDDAPDAGLALLHRLRSEGRAMPVVFYHAAAGSRRAQRAKKAEGAGAFGEAVLASELMALVLRALKGG